MALEQPASCSYGLFLIGVFQVQNGRAPVRDVVVVLYQEV